MSTIKCPMPEIERWLVSVTATRPQKRPEMSVIDRDVASDVYVMAKTVVVSCLRTNLQIKLAFIHKVCKLETVRLFTKFSTVHQGTHALTTRKTSLTAFIALLTSLSFSYTSDDNRCICTFIYTISYTYSHRHWFNFQRFSIFYKKCFNRISRGFYASANRC